MKHKNFFIKLSGVLTLIIFIIIFFALYLVPTLKSINLHKRQLKDMKLKISDFVRVDETFSFPTQRERQYFARTEQEFKNKFPVVTTNEEFITVFTKISSYIQTLAATDGILNLVIKPGVEELSLKTTTPSNGRKKPDLPGTTKTSMGSMRTGLSSLVKSVKSHIITLSFTGELRNAMNFINHLPRGDYYLGEDRILASAGDNFPGYIVYLKFYYIDMGGLASTTGAGQGSEKMNGGLIIDYDSEILLNHVQADLAEPFPKKELPPEFGINIFSKEKYPVEKRSGK